MTLTLPNAVLLFFAALLAGSLNSVAGGGSFISFPALLFTGALRVPANVTNTIALWPGSVASVGAYRKELMEQRANLIPLVGVSLVGGLGGALLLLGTPESTFTLILPFLLLFATLLFTFGRQVTDRLRQRISHMGLSPRTVSIGVLAMQFGTAVYGGYFGGGIGIIMLAILSLWGMENIHKMNALKTALASCINGVAVVAFIISGKVLWPQAAVMVVGAILGGYGGAYYARQLDPKKVRLFVIGVAVCMTVYFFITTYVLPGSR